MSCYKTANDQPRLIRGRHGDTCPMADWHPPLVWDCAGCQPCTRTHCGTCHREHVDELTCPGCIREVRDALRRIWTLVGLPLIDELLARGAASEAAHLLAATANPRQWAQRHRDGYRNHPDDLIGDNHPVWVLGKWDLAVTDLLDHVRTTTVTVTTAVDYLGRNLTDLAQHPDFPFAKFAAEIRACCAHLEDVLRAGEQIEHAAPCVKCRRPLVKVERGYRCTRCRDDLSENQYQLAVREAHIAHSDRLNVDDLAIRLGIPASTIRSWASVLRVQRKGEDAIELEPLIRSCGRDGGNRKVYRVADAQAIRDAGGDRRRASARVSA